MRVFSMQLQRRFSDLDLLGHVNNVVYGDYFQEARVLMFSQLGQGSLEAFSQVLANQSIDYRKPLPYRVEPITIDLWITNIGRTSYSFAARIRDDDETIAAEATGVMVCFDGDSGKSRPIPDAFRAALEKSMEPSS
jgi:acyl-CoA thioester hydrolase